MLSKVWIQKMVQPHPLGCTSGTEGISYDVYFEYNSIRCISASFCLSPVISSMNVIWCLPSVLAARSGYSSSGLENLPRLTLIGTPFISYLCLGGS